MFADRLEHIGRYLNCHPNIAHALRFIQAHGQDEALADGKYVLIPNQVIAHVVSVNTRARETAQMEIHEQFMDIHYILRGEENCAFAPLDPSVQVDPKTDNGFWDCADTGSIRVQEGEFYAVWPREPHCPLISTGKDAPIRKIICKVKID